MHPNAGQKSTDRKSETARKPAKTKGFALANPLFKAKPAVRLELTT